MSDEQEPEPDATTEAEREPEPEPDWVRRRRLAAVFGDVLPEGTSDDSTATGSEPAADRSNEDWLRRQVPPHHG